ncbi:MAG: 50S ribosomal protein L4 [Myxococcota bacterium]
MQKSVRNLPKPKFLQAAGINVYDIPNYEKLVVTQAALNAVIEKALGTQDEGSGRSR